MTAPLTPEQEEQVRAIAAEMIGQALRDLCDIGNGGSPSGSADVRHEPYADSIIHTVQSMSDEIGELTLKILLRAVRDETSNERDAPSNFAPHSSQRDAD